MHLSPEDIAAAKACGVNFLPASEAQVQRLAMQRKVFYYAGEPILATRGDGFFETAGTLQQLIEEGRRQQRDLAQWLQAAGDVATVPAGTPVEVEAKEAGPVPPPAVESPGKPLAAPEPDPEKMLPKRLRQRRRRPELAESWDEPATEAMAEEERDPQPMAAPLPSNQSRSPARSAPRAAGMAAAHAQERGKRWLIAGAARRGRAGKHWSTRQR